MSEQEPIESLPKKPGLGLGLYLFIASLVLPPACAIVVALGTALACEVFRIAAHRLTPAIYAGVASTALGAILLAAAILCLLREMSGKEVSTGPMKVVRILALLFSVLLLPAALWLLFQFLPHA